MNTNQTALVLIELQNDFLAKEGKWYEAVKEVVQGNRLVENTNAAIVAARKQGMKIVHAPIEFSSDYREIGGNPHGIFKLIKDSGAFQKGSWGAKLYDGIDYRDEDIVVEGKSSICAFAGTNLDFILRNHGVTAVVLSGLLTHVCIDSTMRTAYDKGYEVYTLTDCSATIGDEEQRIAVTHSFPVFSVPLTHEQFIAGLRPAEETFA